jgi:hypothetical protein
VLDITLEHGSRESRSKACYCPTALPTARKTPIPRVDALYNDVVLPAEVIGETGWLVYALAATTNAEEMLVGGHTRIKVSADGTTVEEVFPFARTNLRARAGEAVTKVTLTHMVSQTQLEHHVSSACSTSSTCACSRSSAPGTSSTAASCTAGHSRRLETHATPMTTMATADPSARLG